MSNPKEPVDRGRLELRPEVAAFAQFMEAKLRENDHKGGWRLCTEAYLFRRLREETRELRHAVRRRRGGCQVEWVDGEGRECEIEFAPDGTPGGIYVEGRSEP